MRLLTYSKIELALTFAQSCSQTEFSPPPLFLSASRVNALLRLDNFTLWSICFVCAATTTEKKQKHARLTSANQLKLTTRWHQFAYEKNMCETRKGRQPSATAAAAQAGGARLKRASAK